MEPDAHRLDRERLLADRIAVAERVRRDVDAMDEAAVEKRRSYLEWFVNQMRIEAKGERERQWADMRIAFTTSVAIERWPVTPTVQPSRRIWWWEDVEAESTPVALAVKG